MRCVVQRKNHSILALGRISPLKNIETVLGAFKDIVVSERGATLSIFGDPIPRKIDLEYYARIRKLSDGLPAIEFHPGVAPGETSGVFLAHEIFVNATTPGSFDKTILESMSLGTPSFVCQDIWRKTEFSYLSEYFYFPFKDSKTLAAKINSFFLLEEIEKERLGVDCIKFVKEHHSLTSLVDRVLSDI